MSRLGNATILKVSDLKKIKMNSKFKTCNQHYQEDEQRKLDREKFQERARAHQLRLQEFDRNMKRDVNALDVERVREKEAMQRELQRKLKDFRSEELDEVKRMNQIVNNTKCVAIRDKQLDQKVEQYQMLKNRIKKEDLMMEVARLKSIREQQAKDQKWLNENLKGRQIIVGQIKENQMKRLKQTDEQEEEAVEIKKRMKDLEVEDERKRQAKLKLQREHKESIDKSNQQAIIYKQKLIHKEKQENEKRKLYLKKKKEEEEVMIEQKKLMQEIKEKNVAKLREKQEKHQDRQQVLDSIRARRAFQKGEREYRAKELKEAHKRAQMNHELNSKRKNQMDNKKSRIQLEKEINRQMFLKTQNKIQKDLQKEKQQISIKKKSYMKHSEGLKKQIVCKKEKEYQKLRDKEEEGKRIQKVNHKNIYSYWSLLFY